MYVEWLPKRMLFVIYPYAILLKFLVELRERYIVTANIFPNLQNDNIYTGITRVGECEELKNFVWNIA